MRKVSVGILMVVIFLQVSLLCPAQMPIPTSAQKLYESLSPTVVTILVSDKAGKYVKSGSGVITGQDGTILTNFHVVDGGTFYDIRFIDEKKTTQVLPGRPFKADEKRDLAMLRVSSGTPLTTAKIAKELPKVGAKVYAIGSPLSLEGTLSEGIVSQIRKDDMYQFIQTTAPISPGSSGGGLFLDSGELIGITTMSLTTGQNLNFAVPCMDLSSLLPVSSFISRDRAEIEPMQPLSLFMAGKTFTIGMNKQKALSSLSSPYKLLPVEGNNDLWFISSGTGDNFETIGALAFHENKLITVQRSWPIGEDQNSLASTLYDVIESNLSEQYEYASISTETQRFPDGRSQSIKLVFQNGTTITIYFGILKGQTFSVSIEESVEKTE